MRAVHYERRGVGPPLLLLHATLSSARQLRPLATRLEARFSVIRVDRRGSGNSTFEGPARPVHISQHIDDLVAIVANEQLDPAYVVGHSYGGCIALELAARRPDLVGAVFTYEPPYGPLASPQAQADMAEVVRRTLAANDRGDLAAAALTFMEGVSGADAVAALSPVVRARIGRAGQGAVADVSLLGMDAEGLTTIAAPVRIATGGASDHLYLEIAEALVAHIPGASHERLEGLRHMAPILEPEAMAAAIGAFVEP